MGYNVVFPYVYTLWNEQIRLINISVTYLVLWVRTFRIYSFSNFDTYNTLLLTLVTLLCSGLPELIPPG